VREVEFHRYWVSAPGRKRPYLTSFHMTAQAAAKYQDARPEPSSRTVRQMPETEAERRAAMFDYQSAGRDSVKPPKG
jgi:hypothetical protein